MEISSYICPQKNRTIHMKKSTSFLLGLACGFLIAYFYDISKSKQEPSVETETTEVETVKGLSLLSEPGETLKSRSFKIKEVLSDGSALAASKEINNYFGPKVYFLPEEGKLYYDEQIIDVPAGKEPRVIGTFQHYGSTYPVIKFFDK